MGFLNLLSSFIYGSGEDEDPTIYTNKMRGLRDQLRKNWGSLYCIKCSGRIRINLKAIEEQIKQNRKIKMNPLFSDSITVFNPDWDSGSVCINCNGVLCGSCSNQALEDSGGPMLNMPLCPKCEKVVKGIDHITD